MLKIKLSNTKFLSLIILGICLLSISENASFANKIFWGFISLISIFIGRFNFKFKSFLLSIYAVGLLYIQFIFNQYIFSEEFFINCLGVLLIVKYAELDNKNNLLSYNLICMVLGVASLINGQDILSSIISLSIIILLVINMYLIQQKEVMDFNFKNILKYLGFGLSIFPIIIIFYLIFPRAEVNFRLFDPSASSLGIPDNINLGSFREFSNSEEPVFTLINKDYKKDELYFRVKIFDYMNKNKSWRATSNIYMYNTFKNHIRINKGQSTGETYELILEPHKGRWIPSLSNSKLITNDNTILENPFNQNFSSRNPIDRKRKLEFYKYKPNQELFNRLLDYYTLVPDSVSKDLKKWAVENKQNKTDKEYLNTILKTFADGSFYYNLSPENLSKNSYADFFLKNKEGYCEYFAGTFVLLARLANIPSRIVSGYLGGDLNDIGDFYVFRQKDAHAWAEIWFENEGWIRVDPTKFVPDENVRNTLNDLFSNKKTSETLFSLKMFKYVSYYINYADFVWTQHLLSYDNTKRKSFIEDLINLKFSKVFIWIFAPIALFIFVRLLFLFNKRILTQIIINFVIWRFKKKYKLLSSDTHQEIFNKFSSKEKIKYLKLFHNFEILKYSE